MLDAPATRMILLNPKRHSRAYPDERSREVMLRTFDFFERKGKRRLKADDHARVWYGDFLDFVKREGIFAAMCTPAGYGGAGSRWDTLRICEFALHDYPITEADILSRGDDAWNAALNTVNIGKFNLGWASIGICTHAFYEAIDHAAGRRLYGMAVTDFPHVKQMLVDAYARLV